MPATHVGVALLVLHALPQAPQFVGLVAVSMQLLMQHVSPAAQPCVGVHPGMHIMLEQIVPSMQSASERQPMHTCRPVSQT
jgi:hypothetical protein